MLFIPEGFRGLPPNDCRVENAMAVGRSCKEDTTVVTQSSQYKYTRTTKLRWKGVHTYILLQILLNSVVKGPFATRLAASGFMASKQKKTQDFRSTLKNKLCFSYFRQGVNLP